MDQSELDFTPPLAPVVPVVDQRVPQADRPRLGSMSRAIMAALEAGPKTNHELAAMFAPGAAWRTRVSDVRRFIRRSGRTVTCASQGGGLFRYEIKGI